MTCSRVGLSLVAMLALGLGNMLASWPAPDSLEEKLVSHARANRGDAEAGKVFFLANKLACVSCHNLPGEGGSVGPDLKGVGARYDREQLMKKVLGPRPGSAMPSLAQDFQPAEFVNLIAFLEGLR